jgi:hypothetical protein
MQHPAAPLSLQVNLIILSFAGVHSVILLCTGTARARPNPSATMSNITMDEVDGYSVAQLFGQGVTPQTASVARNTILVSELGTLVWQVVELYFPAAPPRERLASCCGGQRGRRSEASESSPRRNRWIS